MMIKTFEDFKEYYEKYGRCINDLGKRKNKMNERQLRSKYDKLIKSEEKKIAARERYIEKQNNKEIEIDERWIEVRESVFNRDNYTCRLMKILTLQELVILKMYANGFENTLDPAHIFRRTERPDLIYDSDNIATLNRFSHSMLDQYRSPLTGEFIGKESCINWWKIIVGEEFYNKLMEK